MSLEASYLTFKGDELYNWKVHVYICRDASKLL